MKVLSLCGARPNFIKIAPIVRAFEAKNLELKSSHPGKRIEHLLVHSGQHYDSMMSEVFFRDLNLAPDIFLSAGSGSHAEQTARIMIAFEAVCVQQDPDVIVVVGDVNTTLAGALVAAKLQIPMAHVEAGLRSFDRTMPEEINRLLTDALAELLFTTEKAAEENLLKEGIAPGKIFFVGNVMIDSLRLLESHVTRNVLNQYGLTESNYAVVTLHRPESVDHPDNLKKLLQALHSIQEQIPIIFPVHPRAKARLLELQKEQQRNYGENLKFVDPVGYLDFISLMKFGRFVITDSGGIQEETTALGIPCITVRKATERPVTVTLGTNVVAGLDPQRIVDCAIQAIQGQWKSGSTPPLWDGKAAERIVDILCEKYLDYALSSSEV